MKLGRCGSLLAVCAVALVGLLTAAAGADVAPKVTVLKPVGVKCTQAQGRCITPRPASTTCNKRTCTLRLAVRSTGLSQLRVIVGGKIVARVNLRARRYIVPVRVSARTKRVSVRLVRRAPKPAPTPVPPPPPAPTPPAPVSVRAVDFMNRDYVIECPGNEVVPISVRGGSWAPNRGGFPAGSPEVSVAYGDANGDGIEEAVVSTACTAGGSGSVPNVIVFTERNGSVMQMGERLIGRDPSFEAGQLLTRLYVRSVSDPAGSYTWTDTTYWQFGARGWTAVRTDRAFTPTGQ